MSQIQTRTVSISEAENACGIDSETVRIFIQREWITPYSADTLDEEDLARIALIQEIRKTFSANDEAVNLILHLLDQVYSLRAQIRSIQRSNRPE